MNCATERRESDGMGTLKRRIIEGMEPAEYELARRWIPVSERLPDAEKVVLVAVNGSVGMAKLYSDGWYWDMDEWHKPFTPKHWMPLPEPPEVK